LVPEPQRRSLVLNAVTTLISSTET
jgi:hypothetical protein